jgi:hypothetical protein
VVLEIEALTRTRLKEAENPLWFWRLHRDFQERRDPAANVSFAAFCSRRHPDKVETVAADRDVPTAGRGKPWHVCDDCLEPLASELFVLANRFRVHFDVAKRDRMENEYRQIQDESAYCDDRLTAAQRERRDELLKQMSAQKEPPRPFDVECLYREYKIDLATDWLKFNVSVDYAADFHRTLLAAQKRFSALDFKACQIINGDLGKESTVQIRYAIQRLIDRHYELLRAAFPNHESHPDRDDLPEDLRAFEVEILDEHTIVEQEFRKTAEYLRRVSALVRSKLAKDQKQAANGPVIDPAVMPPKRPGNRTGRRRGAHPIYDVQSDAKLLRDWNAAKRQRAKKKEFCTARGIKIKDLVAAQARQRERNLRASRRNSRTRRK